MLINQDREFLVRFGDKLRQIRKSKNMTQEELAEKIGVSQVQVARIENGRQNTSVIYVKSVIEALDIQANEIFNDLL